MLEKILKFVFDQIDYHLAKQVPSKMGYGHQIDSRRKMDPNTKFIHNVISSAKNPVKIIELASGRGVLARELIQFPVVESFLACDVDTSGLEVIKKRSEKDKNAHKLSFKLMNCLEPDIEEEEYFDIVLTDKLLHLFSPEDMEKVFKLAYQLLKPGGLFIINSASNKNFVFERTTAENEDDLYRKLKDDMLTRLWYNITIPYVFFITRDYIKEMAEKHGFLYDDNFVCNYDEDYLTVAICKRIEGTTP